LYGHASQILASMDQLQAIMRHAAGAERRRFVIGFVGSTLYGPLPEVIHRFREQVEYLDVSLHECSTVEQIAALKEGRIDVGFGRLRIEDPAIRRLVLAKEKLVAVVSADDPLANSAEPVSLAKLAAQPLIVYPRPARPSYADQVLGAYHDLGLDPVSVMEVRELQTAIGLVAAHAGVSLVPESVQRLQRDDVCYLQLAEAALKSPIMMIHRAGDVSAELNTLIEIGCALHGKDGVLEHD
ncbi:MAG: LysR substrate-binding domain-containing protein, partial [Parasphingopyxis sp.]